MRLLILNDSHYSMGVGGQSTFIQNLHNELIEHAELTYLHLGEKWFSQKIVPIRLLYLIRVFLYFFTSKGRNFNYIISHTPEASFVASFYNIPFCHIFHGNNNPMTKSKFWYGKYLRKVFVLFEIRIKKKALICYTVGEPRLDAKKIFVPIRINFNDIFPQQRSGFFYAGRLERGKNIERTIKIYSKLPPQILHNNNFHIIGAGSQEARLRNLVQSEKLHERVIFHGHLKNAHALETIKAFKILLMTSLFEGFPMIIAESLSLGLPVITTDVGSISEVVKNGFNGFCLPLDSSDESFLDAISLVLNNYETFSENALNSSQIFSPKVLCDTLISDFMSLSEN